jgi:hypothetical protein
MKKGLSIWMLVVIVVIVGGLSFFGGMKYDSAVNVQTNAAGQNARRFGTAGQNGPNGGGATRNGVGFINGDILTKDDKSVTIQMRDGSSKIVFFSDSTKILKSVDGTAADLLAGKSVSVTGTANSDGSISAQMIQFRSPLQDASMKNSQQQVTQK